MRTFLYFENCEGGMAVHQLLCKSNTPIHIDLDSQLKKILYGWRNDDCNKEDADLLAGANALNIGQYLRHRLGVLVRVQNNGGD